MLVNDDLCWLLMVNGSYCWLMMMVNAGWSWLKMVPRACKSSPKDYFLGVPQATENATCSVPSVRSWVHLANWHVGAWNSYPAIIRWHALGYPTPCDRMCEPFCIASRTGCTGASWAGVLNGTLTATQILRKCWSSWTRCTWHLDELDIWLWVNIITYINHQF